MTIKETYDDLLKRIRRIHDLDCAEGLLGWDQRVNLPSKGATARARQVALLSELVHSWIIDPRIGELLGELEANKEQLAFDQQVVVRESRRDYELATKLPTQFVSERARHTAEAYQVWVEARKNNDFASFQPYLEKNLDFARREAGFLGYKESPYDALLDQYDPGLTEKQVAAVFDELRPRLVPIVRAIAESRRRPERERLVTSKRWPEEKQRELGLAIIEKFGYDLEGGRLDVSAHPFCCGDLGDVRITTRYSEEDPLEALTGMMHEAGHAMYEQGFEPETWGTPLSRAVGMAFHESQSRMWENLVGRTRGFWQWAWPLMREYFPEQTRGVELDEFHFVVREVKPDFIRVEADEVTYNLHIILRFELERRMLAGEMTVPELPEQWKAMMAEYLGVVPPDDRRGVLQDMHWSGASFGYFPSYALGNLVAAQVFATAEKELPQLEGSFSRGEFAPLRDWLREKVHRPGMRYRTDELVERITGSPPSADAFLEHLQKDYLPLYTG